MTDDNDRMDRARRIREIREGKSDAQADDFAEESAQGSAETPDGTTDRAASSSETGEASAGTAEAASGAEPERAAEEAGDGTPDTRQEPVTSGGAAGESGQPAESGESPAASASDDDAAAAGGDDDAGFQIPGAQATDVDIDPEQLAGEAGVDPEAVEQADENAVAGTVGMAGAESARETGSTAETRVLEFDLGAERYCLDIEHVEEIVKRDSVTRVPNTPDYVEGVVDLRGQITTILDPKVLLDIDDEGAKDLIVVFDPEEFEDQGAIGWVVDDVNQVTPVVDDEVNESPVDAEHVNGVVERDGEFVVWTDPEIAIENAAG
jgi:purine-binding chemotaxis protein CheW